MQTAQFDQKNLESAGTERLNPSPQRKEPQSLVDLIARIQRVVLYATLLIMPSFAIPLPWGWADYAKGLLMLLSFVVYITLEIVKAINNGKLSMFKGVTDTSLLLIASSILLSTVFSQDFGISLWGLDMRLATGGLVLILTIIYFLFARSVITNRTDFTNVIYSLTIGIGLSGLLALGSYMGVNLFGFSSVLKELFVSGITTYSSTDVAVLVWGVGIILALLTFVWDREHSSNVKTALALVSGIFSTLALIIFSMVVSLGLLILLLVVVGLIVTAVYLRRMDNLKNPALYSVILFGVLLLGVVLARLEPVQEMILNTGSLSGQVKLEGEDAWSIVSSSLTSSISRGLLGVGVDTYALYYNTNRPAVSGGVDLSQTTLTNSNTELLNIVGNRGVAGALLWLGVGFVILSSLYKDLMQFRTNSAYTNLIKVVLSGGLSFIYLASYVSYWGFAGYFIFSALSAISVSGRSLLDPRSSESFVIKLDMLVENLNSNTNKWVSNFVALFIVFLGFLALYAMSGWYSAMGYVLKAESQIVALQKSLQGDEELSSEKIRESVAAVVNNYAKAVVDDPENPVYHRRTALVLIDYADVLVSDLNSQLEGETPNADGEYELNDEQEALRAEVNSAVEAAVEQAETATELDPNVFVNWNVRGYVYAKVIDYGFGVYVDQGINAIAGNAIQLNPLDNIQYQRLAQLYIAKEDLENAVVAINTGLQINPNHIPTLLLASELAVAVEEYEDALNLLDRAKLVLEALELEESEIYTYVTERIDAVKEGAKGGEVEENLDPEVIDDESLLEDEDLTLDDQDNELDNTIPEIKR